MGVPELGAFLRQTREAKGLTQATVARASGIDQSYLSRLEHGDAAYKNIGGDILRALAGVLDQDERRLHAILYDWPAPSPVPGDAPLPVAIRVIAQASAGGGLGREADGFVYIHPAQARGRILKAVRVEGTCLFPTLSPGDVVVIDATPGIKPKEGQIIAATIKSEGERGAYVFKRWGGQEKGKIKLLRDDGEHVPDVDVEDFKLEGVFYLLVREKIEPPPPAPEAPAKRTPIAARPILIPKDASERWP